LDQDAASAGELSASELDAVTAGKIAMYEHLIERAQTAGKEWRARMFDGSVFNWENYHRYEYREVALERPVTDGQGNVIGTERFRLDSYDPGDEVVSRRRTQFADIQPSAGIGYIDEMLKKYNPKDEHLTVSGTPANRAQFGDAATAMVAEPFDGRMVFEVPVQHSPVPMAILEHARKWWVEIRDVAGTVYSVEHPGGVPTP
jgi:hypothetical protein